MTVFTDFDYIKSFEWNMSEVLQEDGTEELKEGVRVISRDLYRAADQSPYGSKNPSQFKVNAILENPVDYGSIYSGSNSPQSTDVQFIYTLVYSPQFRRLAHHYSGLVTYRFAKHSTFPLYVTNYTDDINSREGGHYGVVIDTSSVQSDSVGDGKRRVSKTLRVRIHS